MRALFNSLNPKSIAQSLAFYELYSDRGEGQEALFRATELLRSQNALDVAKIAPLVNRYKGIKEELTEEECLTIERLASFLPNRQLKGYFAKSEEEVLSLPSYEIDLGKALILSQMAGGEKAEIQARHYSALLDLMALQILAELPLDATPLQKITATNYFIFQQMHFRFPPQSIYAQDIDLFTFLPSVMDDHLGVCLGVTALYLAIAQRIDLPLEIVTPPGHIYVRYGNSGEEINIETTARGIHVPSETYLGINTRHLQVRELKEVVGMTHVNQASVYLHTEKFAQARKSYEKALPYMEGDALVTELLAYSCLLTGEEERGVALLKEVVDHTPDFAVAKRVLAEDYLSKKVDHEGIKAVFIQVDETRESILKKQERLRVVLDKYPDFRDGLQQMAISYLQLNRAKEAIQYLRRYHALDANDPAIEYYLSVVHGERHDYKSCWKYLHCAEEIVHARQFSPRALRELRKALVLHCPE
ncbi:MAG: transglutaminase family protein [Chlamydiales bacterium]